MRGYTRALLLMLVVLLYAATASAYKITVEYTSGGYGASDTLVVDIRVDSEGVEAYGWGFYVLQDPLLLSADYAASTLNPIPNQDAGSLYLYYQTNEAWYVANIAFAGNPSINQSVATLVFHVVEDIPASTELIYLNFDYGPYGDFSGEGGGRVTGIVVLTGLHVPEPTATALTLSAIATLTLLRVRRNRAR